VSSPAGPGHGEDPQRGLQRERTALAWDRTGLSFLVASALLLRVAGSTPTVLRHLPGALGILLGSALLLGAARPGGRLREQRPQLLPRLVGLAAVALSVAALALVLLAAG
jgi:uncharacterized membrane protein YidH (DUF202 family)